MFFLEHDFNEAGDYCASVNSAQRIQPVYTVGICKDETALPGVSRRTPLSAIAN